MLLLLFAACGSTPTNAPTALHQPLRVLATTQHIADAVEHIAGDNVQLTMLLGAGIDPHTYVATESNIATIDNADVILYNGHHLEAQLTRIFQQMKKRDGKTVVAVAEELDTASLLTWKPESGLPTDPHIWNDVRLWQQVVSVIGNTLAAADPPHATTYITNAAAYRSELDTLQQYIIDAVQTIPEKHRVLVTAHDAFGYYGRAYGITVEAVQGISTETEASTADVQTLASIVIEHNVPALFIETTISPRTIEAVQAAVQAETGNQVIIGGQLFSDAMGELGTAEATYVGMMYHNTDTIVAALGGTIPVK